MSTVISKYIELSACAHKQSLVTKIINYMTCDTTYKHALKFVTILAEEFEELGQTNSGHITKCVTNVYFYRNHELSNECALELCDALEMLCPTYELLLHAHKRWIQVFEYTC